MKDAVESVIARLVKRGRDETEFLCIDCHCWSVDPTFCSCWERPLFD